MNSPLLTLLPDVVAGIQVWLPIVYQALRDAADAEGIAWVEPASMHWDWYNDPAIPMELTTEWRHEGRVAHVTIASGHIGLCCFDSGAIVYFRDADQLSPCTCFDAKALMRWLYGIEPHGLPVE